MNKKNLVWVSALLLCLLLSACTHKSKSLSPTDPKKYLSESNYDEISFLELYEYVVNSSKISNPKLSTLELKISNDKRILYFALEIFDSSSAKTFTPNYDSNSNIFKVKVTDRPEIDQALLFDVDLLSALNSVLNSPKLDFKQTESYSIYFMNMLSAGKLDPKVIKNSEFYLVQLDKTSKLKSSKQLDSSFYYFAVYNDVESQAFPMYFIVPKK